MTSNSAELQIAVEAVNRGIPIIVDNFGRTVDIARKQYSEIVTNVDREVEDAVLEYLRAERPDYGLLSEETGAAPGKSDLFWVVDPLDGTSNFVLGIPHVAISIALCRKTEILVGVVANAFRPLQYTAEYRQGAMLNDKPLHVSQTNSLAKATIGHIVSYEEKRKRRALDLSAKVRSRCYRLLDTWAPSLDWCLLAQGKLDGLISLDAGKFDRLAGTLIVQETGGLITDFEGNPPTDLDNGYLLASNGTELHAELLEIVNEYYPKLTTDQNSDR
jgi:myo-inositol-1(or 4)-monophosphatase